LKKHMRREKTRDGMKNEKEMGDRKSSEQKYEKGKRQ